MIKETLCCRSTEMELCMKMLPRLARGGASESRQKGLGSFATKAHRDIHTKVLPWEMAWDHEACQNVRSRLISGTWHQSLQQRASCTVM